MITMNIAKSKEKTNRRTLKRLHATNLKFVIFDQGFYGM